MLRKEFKSLIRPFLSNFLIIFYITLLYFFCNCCLGVLCSPDHLSLFLLPKEGRSHSPTFHSSSLRCNTFGVTRLQISTTPLQFYLYTWALQSSFEPSKLGARVKITTSPLSLTVLSRKYLFSLYTLKLYCLTLEHTYAGRG